MIQIEYLALILTGIGIIVSILYYASVLRNANKTQQLALETRQAQLFMYMYDRWSNPESIKHGDELETWEWTDYDDFLERYGQEKNPERYISFSYIARFLEGVGVLVKRKLVDPLLVDDLMSGNILDFWDKFGDPLIKKRQVLRNYPQYYEHVEYLYKVIKPIVDSQHPELKT
jgi:hypothetical protein